MNRRYLLDTNIVSAPVTKEPDPEILERLELHSDECAIAAPVWHELVFGCQRLPRGRKRLAIEAYLEDVVLHVYPMLPYDQTAADRHGTERARLAGLGTPAPFVDAQIAAIAYVNDLVLVTRSSRDFERYEGLKVESWSAG